MRFKTAIGLLLLVGCVKHIETHVGPSTHPVISPDKLWAYYVDGPSDWTLVTRIGTKKPLETLCPHGAVCTLQEIGTMFKVRRVR